MASKPTWAVHNVAVTEFHFFFLSLWSGIGNLKKNNNKKSTFAEAGNKMRNYKIP